MFRIIHDESDLRKPIKWKLTPPPIDEGVWQVLERMIRAAPPELISHPYSRFQMHASVYAQLLDESKAVVGFTPADEPTFMGYKIEVIETKFLFKQIQFGFHGVDI